MFAMTSPPFRTIQRAVDSVAMDHDKFIRACRCALAIQTAMFVAAFVLVWVRT